MADKFGIVKKVLSGDTLLLMGPVEVNGRRPERMVYLASIIAPKVSHTPDMEEEPFAWNAKEFVRGKTIGETVRFTIDYKDAHGRDFVTLECNGLNLNLSLVEQGLAKVFCHPLETAKAVNYDDLNKAELSAQKAKLGIWSTDPDSLSEGKRQRNWIIGDVSQAKEIAKSNLHKEVMALIEDVKSAVLLQVYIKEFGIYASLRLTGLDLPPNVKQPDGRVVESPYARQAKQFIELRVLHKEILVRIEGDDSFGNIYGTLIHPRGNISVLLLEEGLARTAQSVELTAQRKQYDEAQSKAQKHLRKIWEGSKKESEYYGRVIEVFSGESFSIIEQKFPNTNIDLSHEERRVYLAGIRCPRVGLKNQQDEPWGFEAKAYTLKKCLGKRIKLKFEYTREIPLKQNEKTKMTMEFVTAWIDEGQTTLNELLVKEGLARPVPARNDQPNVHYSPLLQEANSKASSEKKGIHGPPALLDRINDLTSMDKKKQAKSLIESLKRLGPTEGTIERIINSRRFKIRINRESITLGLLLAGIWVPELKDYDTEKEAMLYLRLNYLHRPVMAQISDWRPKSGFLGLVWHKKSLINAKLVLKGFAAARRDAVVPIDAAKEIIDAQEKAKKQNLGIWSKEWVRNEEEEVSSNAFNPVNLGIVDVTFIESLGNFWVQCSAQQENQRTALEMNDLIKHYVQSNDIESKLPYYKTQVPPVDTLCLVKCSFEAMSLTMGKDQWHRGKVERIVMSHAGKQSCEMYFVDTGALFIVDPSTSLYPCPPELSLDALPPAPLLRCELSSILNPSKSDLDTNERFLDYCAKSQLFCISDSYDKRSMKHSVVLLMGSDESAKKMVNLELIEDGYAELSTYKETSRPLKHYK